MRAGTIYIYFLFVCFYCSYHAPFLEVQDRHHGGGVCVARPPGQIMHVCPPCACRCASNIYPRPETSVCIPALYLNPTIRTRRGRNPKTSLSTAINKDVFFFRGIFSYVTVLCTCYLKLLKDCVDVPFNKRLCAHPESDACLKISSIEMGCFCFVRPHLCKITCSSSPAGTRPSHPLSVTATYPGWVSTGTRFLTAPEWHPTRNSSLQKSRKLFESRVSDVFRTSELFTTLKSNNPSLSVCSRLLFLPSEKLRKQISASNQLHYSCDTWPITIETALITYQTNTCADIRRIIHNVNIIRPLWRMIHLHWFF